LAKQGLYFVYLDNTHRLFSSGTLTEQAKNSIEAIREAGLVLILSDFSSSQVKEFMKISKQSVLIVKKQVPSSEELELIKDNKAVLGLFLSPEENPEAYFKKLDKVKNLLGREAVAIINGQSLWEKAGQDQMTGATSQILKAGYEWYDIVYPFSRSFLTLLDTTRGMK
jgi:hypothetical protein